MKSTNVVMLKVAYKDFITFADRTVFPPFLSHELDIILTVAAKAYQTDAKFRSKCAERLKRPSALVETP